MPDRVQYEAAEEAWLAWKYPSEELRFGSVVVVHESQFAVFVHKGRIADILPPGRHLLETANLPVVSRWLKRAFDGKTPFPAEVWFVNRLGGGTIRWGALGPTRAHGTLAFDVVDPGLLLRKLVGTLAYATADLLRDRMTPAIAQALSGPAAPPAGEVAASLRPRCEEVGVRLRELIEATQRESHAFTLYGIKVAEALHSSLSVSSVDRVTQRLPIGELDRFVSPVSTKAEQAVNNIRQMLREKK